MRTRILSVKYVNNLQKRMVPACILASILLLVLVVGSTYTPYRDKYDGEQIFILKVSVTYVNRDEQAIWNLSEEDRAVSLFMNNSWQTVYLIEISHPIEKFTYDSDGNKIAILNLTKTSIFPGEKITYNVTYRMVFKQRVLPAISEENSGNLSAIPENLKKIYCQSNSLWQPNSSIFKRKALEIAGNETKVLSIVKRFVKWINRHIRYRSSEIPRYPNETLQQLAGDCDDQANLLITFCRAIGIPAYLQIGCIYMPGDYQNLTYWNGRLTISERNLRWHGWAMVYVPPWGWLPVDLTYVSGNLAIKPLNSITRSAVIEHYTFQYMNITETDYVAESEAFKSFLESYKFYVYESEEMYKVTERKEGISIINVRKIIIFNAKIRR
ncbi:transglutaminase domain-containing protein [Candidatus Bathyarchaeota archaeon]|nr:transglutaminase domain-containing protein [Candidatus Bathyarchaeota archaeon]